MVKHFWGDKDEYRWEYPHIGQGHYIYATDLEDAAMQAVAEAKQKGLGEVITIQKFKPTRGKIYRLYVSNLKKSWR